MEEGISHDTPLVQTSLHDGVYGFDQGRPDLDLPRNNDADALTLLSPGSKRKHEDQRDYFVDTSDPSRTEFGFGLYPKEDSTFKNRDYYEAPIPVKIPRSLEPLPPVLRENPMNLLYFHHFLNHVARILVPHDCPENPFRCVLPQSKCLSYI